MTSVADEFAPTTREQALLDEVDALIGRRLDEWTRAREESWRKELARAFRERISIRAGDEDPAELPVKTA